MGNPEIGPQERAIGPAFDDREERIFAAVLASTEAETEEGAGGRGDAVRPGVDDEGMIGGDAGANAEVECFGRCRGLDDRRFLLAHLSRGTITK